jgi:DNA-binding response OmpR family regulator
MPDIGLPDLGGRELGRRLKKGIPGLVLIVISGWDQAEDRRRSEEAGFRHHLVKPTEFARLGELIIPAG